jgi:hypothetical protein
MTMKEICWITVDKQSEDFTIEIVVVRIAEKMAKVFKTMFAVDNPAQ